MRTKKKSTKRIGISLALLAAVFLPLVPSAAAAKKKPVVEDSAVISGTVFEESGYALPEAKVTLVAEPSSGETRGKPKKMEAVSDSRGEFVFHVPPGPGQYTIAVAAKGYRGGRKSVAVEGLERVEVTFQLERESK
ncbi:MAG TPA: carboxypeptidase-like regulatory domain-containing protein [Bryobacteraceae bacterium]|nr:carboxypeptidase-like regulatory domain-containing protein [Bryobacteraceae bacterium]